MLSLLVQEWVPHVLQRCEAFFKSKRVRDCDSEVDEQRDEEEEGKQLR